MATHELKAEEALLESAHAKTAPASKAQHLISVLRQGRTWMLLSFILLFALAVAIRFYRIDQPWDGILVERQYRSQILARAMYFQNNASIPEWRREVALVNAQREGTLEPPIQEFLAASIYRLTNEEFVWIGQVFSGIFCLFGATFLFLIARRLVTTAAALFVTGFYLLMPEGIVVSRSFQPDSLMIAVFLAGIWSLIWFYDRPTLARLAVAAGIAGLGFFIKPLCLFATYGAFISVEVYTSGIRKVIASRRFLLFSGVSLLPMTLYYGLGLLMGQGIKAQAQLSLRPYLLLKAEFWEGWFQVGIGVVGSIAFVAALIGVPLLREGLPRALVTGLWGGYLIFGAVFSFNTFTHGYYHLQLIPIVGLSFAPIVALVADHFVKAKAGWRLALALGVLVLMVSMNVADLRHKFGSSGLTEEARTAQEIGSIVGHSTNTVFLARNYGRPLQFHGDMSGYYWERSVPSPPYRQASDRELSVQERFEALSITPDYFIITDFKEYERHHADLKAFLESETRLVAQSEKYLIYDMKDVDLNGQN